MVDNGAVNQSGQSSSRLTIYAGAAVLGVMLLAVAIVVGVILKDLSTLGVVATTVPGIALLLVGIRGNGLDGDESG
jgi:hypothetical protein